MELTSFLDKIEALCKQRGIKRQIVYTKCGIGKNFGVSIRNGSEPSIGKVLALATELDCSVDYLLGRTENPEAHKFQNSYVVNNKDTVVNGTQANVVNGLENRDVLELVELIQSLPIVKRAEAILAVEEIKNKE